MAWTNSRIVLIEINSRPLVWWWGLQFGHARLQSDRLSNFSYGHNWTHQIASARRIVGLVRQSAIHRQIDTKLRGYELPDQVGRDHDLESVRIDGIRHKDLCRHRGHITPRHVHQKHVPFHNKWTNNAFIIVNIETVGLGFTPTWNSWRCCCTPYWQVCHLWWWHTPG